MELNLLSLHQTQMRETVDTFVCWSSLAKCCSLLLTVIERNEAAEMMMWNVAKLCLATILKLHFSPKPLPLSAEIARGLMGFSVNIGGRDLRRNVGFSKDIERPLANESPMTSGLAFQHGSSDPSNRCISLVSVSNYKNSRPLILEGVN